MNSDFAWNSSDPMTLEEALIVSLKTHRTPEEKLADFAHEVITKVMAREADTARWMDRSVEFHLSRTHEDVKDAIHEIAQYMPNTRIEDLENAIAHAVTALMRLQEPVGENEEAQ